MANPLTQTSHAQGYSSYNRPATLVVRSLAAATDLCILLAVFLALVFVFHVDPYPSAWLLLWATTQTCALWFLQRRAFGITVGGRVWRLGTRRNLDLQKEKLTAQTMALAAGATLSAAAAVSLAFDLAVASHPLFIKADTLKLARFMPDLSPNSDWAVMPYFYSMGAWPKRYNGHPITHSLPYEKGPPVKFVGHVTAQWEAPDTKLTFEGPKTPLGAPSRDQIRDCLLYPWSASHGLSPMQCLAMRETSLLRHFREIERIGPSNWKVSWFWVENPGVPPEQQAQGIYLTASNATVAQARYILITPNGTHQAFILDYPSIDLGTTVHGAPATTLQEAVRSLRVSDDLKPGLEWIDHQITTVKLDKKTPAPELADIEGMLLSRITVDPKLFDTFFYLGEVSLFLSRDSALGGLARQNVHSAFRFAQDVAPSDPRMPSLQGYWVEAQK